MGCADDLDEACKNAPGDTHVCAFGTKEKIYVGSAPFTNVCGFYTKGDSLNLTWAGGSTTYYCTEGDISGFWVDESDGANSIVSCHRPCSDHLERICRQDAGVYVCEVGASNQAPTWCFSIDASGTRLQRKYTGRTFTCKGGKWTYHTNKDGERFVTCERSEGAASGPTRKTMLQIAVLVVAAAVVWWGLTTMSSPRRSNRLR